MSTSRILVINSGSSSLKFKLFDVVSSTLAPSISGLVERIGDVSSSRMIVKGLSGGNEDLEVAVDTHTTGLKLAFELVREKFSRGISEEVKAVGHRFVHGGTFSSSIVLDEQKIDAVAKAGTFAPLHMPANISGVRAAQSFFEDRPQVAVFDTAFHQTMPPAAYLYGLPYHLYRDKGIRRYGFHGTSYRYLTQRASEMLAKPQEELNLVVAHLGAGSSMCCVRNGKSIDTSMGMTPLEGLVMGSRCGDIDPGLLPFLSDMGMSIADIDKMLNKESGLLGLAGAVDIRPILAGAVAGDERCLHTLEVYTHRIRKYLGAYLLQLAGETDAIIFSAGVGEHSSVIRDMVCRNLAAFGIVMDDSANEKAEGAAVISAMSSKIKILVVPTDEELCIAQDTAALAGIMPD